MKKLVLAESELRDIISALYVLGEMPPIECLSTGPATLKNKLQRFLTGNPSKEGYTIIPGVGDEPEV